MDLKDDALRCRFTAWMKVVVKRAKIDYIRRHKSRIQEVSMESEEFVDSLIYEPVEMSEIKDGFLFENERLSSIFQNLSPKRRQILELLFLHNLTPEEVALEMGCSLQNVYNMRSMAIKEIRNKLGTEV